MPNKMNKKRLPVIILGLFGTGNCQAFDYYLNPRFVANQRYDTNINMQQDPRQAHWVSIVSPGADFAFSRDNSEFKSSFTWNQLFYFNNSSLNIDEQLLHVDYQHKLEQLEWKFKGDYNNQSSLSTEETGTGAQNNLTQVLRKQINLNPSVSYTFDSKNSLVLDYNFVDVKYQQNQNLFFLSDYDYHQASTIFYHLYSEQDKFNLSLSSSRYKTPVQDQTSYNHVAQLGWQHSFNEQFSSFISAGANYAQTESTVAFQRVFSIGGTDFFFDPFSNRFVTEPGLTTKEDFVGSVFQVGLQKNFERGSVSINSSQQQSPTAQGLQTRTEVAVNNVYALSDRWSTGLTASYSINEVDSEQNNRFNRTNYSISPTISWKWTPEVNLRLSYTYRQQKYEGQNQPSEGNVALLQFTYQPQINRQVK